MGMVHAEITLKNVTDEVNVKNGLVKDQAIRQATVTALVDTGAITLVINEKLCQQLGLGIRGERYVTLADKARVKAKIADPVGVYWKDRSATCDPFVLPGDTDVLLGAIPMEHMDLIVDPKNQRVVGAHGDEIVSPLYNCL